MQNQPHTMTTEEFSRNASGSRYFCESLFWASQPNQAAKKYATTDASGGPDSSASPRFDPTRGR
ncbi:MAG: hypothetical protein Q8K07_14805, partial [Methylicorpusculum sp.]|nr:hypothetical protein [Methylicorpusculum sp.]